MKTNGTYQRGIAALAGRLILVLGGCADPFIPGEKESAGETIPPGMGLARISLALGGERTAVPDIGNSYYFTLKFTAPGQADVNKTLSPGTSALTVALAPVTWNLEVKGYAEDTYATIKLSGNISVPITAGTAANFNVYLTPNLGLGGLGSLQYTINLSALPASKIRAWFGLYPLEAVGTSANPAISQEFNISASAGNPAAPVTLPSLPQGTYRAVIDLYNSAYNTAAVRTEVVHIYADMVTPFVRVFTAADFAACPPVVGDGLATLAAKLDAALASAEAEVCTIVLNGTEADLATFEPRTLNIPGPQARTLIIRGGGATVQVDRQGTPLFTLTGGYGSTLELRDITLTGKSSNSVPVVQVWANGTLAMKTGSRITGNANSSSDSSGGVHVNGGTFNMSGGAVSGNTSSSNSSGGGVRVSVNGTFDMSGGAVSGNSSSSYSSGGGVCVKFGTFNMSGGTVRDNILSNPDSYGREVLVAENGTFKLSGEAMPQRVFLQNNSKYITISGPLSGGAIPIDLGITAAVPLAGYEGAQILRLDSAYGSGDLAELRTHFSLGDAKRVDSSDAGTPISGYKIDNAGIVVVE
jgi:hypothetical protein